MNKQEYIKKFLEDEIKEGEDFIKSREEMNDSVRHLPNDCSGIEIDGEICHNPDYKLDLLTSNSHSIGYMRGLIETSKKILMLNSFDDIEFQDFLKKEEETRKHNDKVMQELKDYINSKNPDLLKD
jgi:uncharacterized HAD superfamily protein